jgi:hypothetical protein
MPVAVKMVKAHLHFGVIVPVCVKGRKTVGRWRATQYRVFRPTTIIHVNNTMAGAPRTVDKKRTTPINSKTIHGW